MATAPHAFCAAEARAAGAPIAGTAVAETWCWIGVELPGPWSAKPLTTPHVAPALREALVDLNGRPGHRVQLLMPSTTSRRRVWWADTRLSARTLVRWDTDDQDTLAATLATGRPPATATVVDTPVVWVCTHGRRDACCAKWGNAFWRALIAQGRVAAQPTSHLGGHRAAATCVVLPEGLQYGALDADDAPQLAHSVRDASPWVDHLRGRTCLTAPEQVAEIAARQQSPLLGRLLSATTVATTPAHSVTLAFVDTTAHCQVHATPGVPLRPSCTSLNTKPTTRWRVTDLTLASAPQGDPR